LCYFTADDGAKHMRGRIPLARATVAYVPTDDTTHTFQIITP